MRASFLRLMLLRSEKVKRVLNQTPPKTTIGSQPASWTF